MSFGTDDKIWLDRTMTAMIIWTLSGSMMGMKKPHSLSSISASNVLSWPGRQTECLHAKKRDIRVSTIHLQVSNGFDIWIKNTKVFTYFVTCNINSSSYVTRNLCPWMRSSATEDPSVWLQHAGEPKNPAMLGQCLQVLSSPVRRQVKRHRMPRRSRRCRHPDLWLAGTTEVKHQARLGQQSTPDPGVNST